jgi:hypothetical protein
MSYTGPEDGGLLIMKKVKKIKSFRLSPEVTELVARAAEESGKSEGEIVEACILGQVDCVTTFAVRQREKTVSPRAAGDLARSMAAPVAPVPKGKRN